MYSQDKQGPTNSSTSRRMNSYENLGSDVHSSDLTEDIPTDVITGLREWLRTHLKGMRALLNNLSNTTWYYLRTRWGPDSLDESIRDQHIRKVECFGNSMEAFDENDLSSDAWWLRSREGPPTTVGTRNRTGASKRSAGRPNRLRNPRSKQTRELCLLNRLRVHLNDRVLLAVGNEETNWGAAVDGVPRLAGSYEIQSQRWARTLPRGPSQYTMRRYVSRNTSLPSRKQEVRHW
jgi:hypothetical protein